ncbi:hybrid sensor histidine kinase/response regulator [Ottowia testudinis]|uniref:Chemotaxis protein CheA n=1 Tax=Ottowia testudinis TaxID=2816950 RepID=A0A975CGM2_9BURK|nr:response regulator [Ottowia testudinis]QTD45417.1 response regulator [Ottowia testudinis]
MKLHDLIEALASEIEFAQPQLGMALDELAQRSAEDPAFMDALDQYSGQAQRMGEAAEMAGFPGLQAVCEHVLENTLLLPAYERDERLPLLQFLRAWPALMVHYLRNLSDPSTAAGLVDHLRDAPSPMDEELALRVMHQLGAMPQTTLLDEHAAHSSRPVLATPDDVALVVPADVDQKLLEGFLQEAPDQARHLVELALNMVSGQGDSSDIIAAKRIAHTMKGSGATIGLRGLAALGHHFEDILEHFETEHSQVTKPVADVLLDAAYCLAQMVDYITGDDEYPEQSQSVLQRVLDLANRIDRGESLDMPVTRIQNDMGSSTSNSLATTEASATAAVQAAPRRPAVASHGAALRVSVDRVEELFRVSGEVSVHSAAMETRIKQLGDSAKALLAQNLRLQKRLFELETVVDVRALTMMRGRSQREDGASFDPLEMDQYSELHSTAHALVEEAADARLMAHRMEEDIARLSGMQTRQQLLSRDLQHLVTSTRMAEVSVLESRLQRNVRTTCQATGKLAVLVLEGGDTLIDSDVLNRLAEPLLHLIRNAVDHGLESPAERLRDGKPEAGTITLSFTRQGQQVVLRCSDDGRGLDLLAIQSRGVERGLIQAGQAMSEDEITRLILMPGFSTRAEVSEVSGRGVGLDVVRDWVNAMNGTVRVTSTPRRGCTIELRFAASLSTIQSLIVEVSGERFALPSVQIEQAVPRGVGRFERLGGRVVYHHLRRAMSALHLAQVVGLSIDTDKPLDEYDVVIVQLHNTLHALAVDRLMDSRELLVKSPGRYARHLMGVSGLSILGDGGIAVNLDLTQLLQGTRRQVPAARSVEKLPQREQARASVLIVDDALSVRSSLQQLVEDAGFRAETARDGIEAIDAMRAFKPDVLLTDLEMPNMNGVELTSHVRQRDDLKQIPVIMITSRSQEKHRKLAEQAGVDVYITKPYSDGDLLQKIRQAIAAPVEA